MCALRQLVWNGVEHFEACDKCTECWTRHETKFKRKIFWHSLRRKNRHFGPYICWKAAYRSVSKGCRPYWGQSAMYRAFRHRTGVTSAQEGIVSKGYRPYVHRSHLCGPWGSCVGVNRQHILGRQYIYVGTPSVYGTYSRNHAIRQQFEMIPIEIENHA